MFLLKLLRFFLLDLCFFAEDFNFFLVEDDLFCFLAEDLIRGGVCKTFGSIFYGLASELASKEFLESLESRIALILLCIRMSFAFSAFMKVSSLAS